MALVGFGKRAATDPQRAIRAFFVGETAKVTVVIVLFVVVLKTMKVVPLAMLGAYIATFFVFWWHWPTRCHRWVGCGRERTQSGNYRERIENGSRTTVQRERVHPPPPHVPPEQGTVRILDFSVIHWDSVFFSVALAILFGGSFYLAARRATTVCRRSFRTRGAGRGVHRHQVKDSFTAPTSCWPRWR